MKKSEQLEEVLAFIIATIILSTYVIVLFLASLQTGLSGFIISAGILYFIFIKNKKMGN